MPTGIELIAQERKEQIDKHGRSIQRDVEINPNGELCWAAALLLHTENEESPMDLIAPLKLPDWNQSLLIKMDSKSYKERLTIAGALISAEIDRLEATAPQSEGKGKEGGK